MNVKNVVMSAIALDVLHTDVYGICPCDTCECDDPKNSGEECLSCQ
jgi:hypothetical protein